MKQFFFLPFFALLLVACGGPEGQSVTSGEAVDTETADDQANNRASRQYLVDPTASKVTWEGTKLVGGGHTGEIPVEFGQIIVTEDNDEIVAGQFSMDIRKITNTDMEPDQGGDKLVSHLKSADFFDVEKYPMANFDLASISKAEGKDYTHEFMGNLTLKGKTRSVTIPADITMEGEQLMVTTPQFVIDRNEWDITYGNSTLGLAQDKIINDEVGLKIDLVANLD